MRNLISLLSLAALLIACGQQPTPTAAPPSPTLDARTAAVSEVVNLVEGRAAETEPFTPVSIGYLLTTGGQVRTGDASRARLDFSDGTIVRLAQNSTFIMTAVTSSGGGLVRRLQLELGKIWVSLTGGTLQVETPVGVATVRGSFAVIQYTPGDPANPDDDLLVVDCLEGSCLAQNANVDERLGNLERVVLNRIASLRLPLTGADVESFLLMNPESQGLSATLTAAPPATDTPAPTETPTPLPSPTFTPTFLPSNTAPPTETPFFTATPIVGVPTPSVAIIGQHTVRAGETLYCIARGYGVLPSAIAQVNGLSAPFDLNLGQVLRIPAVKWTNIPPGPVCAPQFTSPFPAPPASTPTPAASATTTLTPTPTCPPGEFFDPVQKRCRPPDTTTAPLVTDTPTITPPPTNTPTITPPPTDTPTITPTPDFTVPTISGLSANPTSVDQFTPGCVVTFTATINDASGIASASVSWATFTMGMTQVMTGTFAMSGPPSGGVWSVTTTVTNIPSYGYLDWVVTAQDGSPQMNTTTSPAGPQITAGSYGCP